MLLLRPARRLLTDPDVVAVVVPAGRVAAAATMLAAPEATLRALGSDTTTARRAGFVTRMMAVRDGALGVGGLFAGRRAATVLWLLTAAACDATDAVVVAAALRADRLRGPGAVGLVAFAGTTAAVQVAAALRLRRRR